MATPEFILGLTPRVDQWLFANQQRSTQVKYRSQTGKQQKTYDGDYAYRSNTKIEAIGYAGADTENPGRIAVAV